MRMRLMSCLPNGDAYDFILGILSSGFALFINSSQERSSDSISSTRFWKRGCSVNSSICFN